MIDVSRALRLVCFTGCIDKPSGVLSALLWKGGGGEGVFPHYTDELLFIRQFTDGFQYIYRPNTYKRRLLRLPRRKLARGWVGLVTRALMWGWNVFISVLPDEFLLKQVVIKADFIRN